MVIPPPPVASWMPLTEDWRLGNVVGTCLAGHHREASLQDKMAYDGYLPTIEELNFRRRLLEELPPLSRMGNGTISGRHAVRFRRFLTSALLLQNFQRAETISNAKLPEIRLIQGSGIRVKDHNSSAS